MSGECMLLGSLSHHNNDLEQRTLKPSVRHSSQVLNKSCHSSQTNQCYSSTLFRKQQENPSSKKRREWRSVGGGGGGLERERKRERKSIRTWERERERAWLLLLHVFFPLGLPYANWAQPGVLFYLKSSLWSSDLSLTFLYSIFMGFSLPCLLAITILDSFSLF